MKISKITIKQLFGIKEWQGDGKNIELVGDNGTGKTSVIDAIRYALTNSSDREFIVKNGETEGEIYIETDNGLSIDRKARTAMTDYKSVKQNGNVIPSPESFLKTIFTPLQLSPMEFISMDKKTQNATILDMIQYDWNLDTIKEWFGEIPRDVNYEQNILAVLNDIQAENGYYFMHRQDVNRDIRAKKAVIADIGSSLPIDYDGERWEKENLSDLYTEIENVDYTLTFILRDDWEIAAGPDVKDLNIQTFTFGEAVRRLKAGQKVTRKGWNGKGMFVVYQKGYPQGIPCNKQTAEAWGLNEGDLFVCNPYLQIRCVDGSHSMWVPSINDCLAEDWCSAQ